LNMLKYNKIGAWANGSEQQPFAPHRWGDPLVLVEIVRSLKDTRPVPIAGVPVLAG